MIVTASLHLYFAGKINKTDDFYQFYLKRIYVYIYDSRNMAIGVLTMHVHSDSINIVMFNRYDIIFIFLVC